MVLVRYENADNVSRITLCDPTGTNPINLDMCAEFWDAIRQARADEPHVVVLSSEGKTFTVGGDVPMFAASESPRDTLDDVTDILHRSVEELMSLDSIVVSVVHAVAAGAGVALAAAADIVLAAESASFTLAYTRIGYSPDGGTTMLASSIGVRRLLDLALLNPRISAQHALEIGLISQVHPDADLPAAVEAVVADLRRGSKSAQVATKKLIRSRAFPDVAAALRAEALSIQVLGATPDGTEGVQAFVQRRPAVFPSSGHTAAN